MGGNGQTQCAERVLAVRSASAGLNQIGASTPRSLSVEGLDDLPVIEPLLLALFEAGLVELEGANGSREVPHIGFPAPVSVPTTHLRSKRLRVIRPMERDQR